MAAVLAASASAAAAAAKFSNDFCFCSLTATCGFRIATLLTKHKHWVSCDTPRPETRGTIISFRIEHSFKLGSVQLFFSARDKINVFSAAAAAAALL